MSRVSNNILKRVYILMLVFVFFASLIIVRVIGLQLNRETWLQKETEERIEFMRVVADRGSILSEKGQILATSLPFYRIAMDPTVVDTAAIENFQDSLFTLASLLATRFGEFKTDSIIENDTTVTYFQYQDTMEYYHRIHKAMLEKDRHIYLTRKTVDFRELKEIQQWPILVRGRWKGGLAPEKIHNKKILPIR